MAPTIEDAPTPSSGVAVVIVNYRTPALALECLATVEAARSEIDGLRAVLVDGGSDDGSAATLRGGIVDAGWEAWIDFLALPRNGGFGYANNQALLLLAGRAVPPEYVCLLNPDARLQPSALSRLKALLDRAPDAAAVGAQLVAADGGLQGSAFSFPTIRGELSRGAQTDVLHRLIGAPSVIFSPATAQPVPWVTGAAVMLRWRALADVGLFDDQFFLYFEEVELMHRLRSAGWGIWHEPAARVEHIGGAATDVHWDETGYHKPQPLPAYWYQSRRRCLVKIGGTGFALIATAAFLFGRLIWLGRAIVQGRRDQFPRRTSRDTIGYSWWPSRSDRAPALLPRLGDAPGQLPGWMRSSAAR